MKAVVIIPTYNERENISPLIDRLEEVFKKLNNHQVEVLVVDDSSPDGTAKIVAELAQQHHWLHLLVRPKKEGLGAAYVAGMDYATSHLGAEVVLEMDADLSHDPKLIPQFLFEIDQGADLVIGSRYISGGSIPPDWGIKRKVLSKFGNLGICLILGHFGVHDWSSGYRAVRSWVFNSIKNDLNRFTGYTFQVAFVYKALRLKAKVAEIPLVFVDRRLGESKFPTTAYVFDTLAYIFKVRVREMLAATFFKFCVVGFIGFLINFFGLEVFVKMGLPPSTAAALGAEAAIVSNFIWNNLWTFSHARLRLSQVPFKFFLFNLTSAGAVIIQYSVLKVGELYYGLVGFKAPVRIGLLLARYHLFFLIAVVIGLVWNFFFYSKVIWKTGKDRDLPTRDER